MKTIYRNLLSVIRRFKMATLLNVAGLSVAFAAFMVIMMQVNYDRTFDTSDPNHDRIFRVEFMYQENAQVVINRPLAEAFFASSPHIVAGALSSPYSTDRFFSVENNGIKQFYEEKCIQVSPEYTEVFTFDFVEGTKEVLKQPDHVMIPLSMAQKLFGNQPAVGRQLTGRHSNMIVGAVYRDFPANTLVRNIVYATIPPNENKTNWGNWNYQMFVRMDDPDNMLSVYENFKKNNKANPQMIGQTDEFDWEKLNAALRFTPLTEVHYVTDAIFDFTPKASRQTLRVLFAIAIVVIVIAGINFTNFSTALTPVRIKSINTQKVLGGSQGAIRRSLVLEAMLISLFSYVIAIGLRVSDVVCSHGALVACRCGLVGRFAAADRGRNSTDRVADGATGRTVSVVLHDLVPSCAGIERELRIVAERPSAAQRAYQRAVYRFVCIADRCVVYVFAKSFYAAHTVGIRKRCADRHEYQFAN